MHACMDACTCNCVACPKRTLTWMGHDFGLRRAQLLTLNPKLFISVHLNPVQPHHPQGACGANPKPLTQHPAPHHGEGGRGLNTKPETRKPASQHTIPYRSGGEVIEPKTHHHTTEERGGLNNPNSNPPPHQPTTTAQHTTPRHRGERGA